MSGSKLILGKAVSQDFSWHAWPRTTHALNIRGLQVCRRDGSRRAGGARAHTTSVTDHRSGAVQFTHACRRKGNSYFVASTRAFLFFSIFGKHELKHEVSLELLTLASTAARATRASSRARRI